MTDEMIIRYVVGNESQEGMEDDDEESTLLHCIEISSRYTKCPKN